MICIISCSTPKQKEYEQIEKYFKKIHNFKIDKTINKIVVITEGRTCGTCDRAFAKTVFKNLQNENTLFLVSATGNQVDIQPFLNIEKNCFFDWELNVVEYPEFKSSRVIYLKDNAIDTIVILNSMEIMQQLEYFKK